MNFRNQVADCSDNFTKNLVANGGTGLKRPRLYWTKQKHFKHEIKCEVSRHHIEKIELALSVHTNVGLFETQNLLIATGAAETAAPIPGWTLPGVMSIGAAQVMTNVHRVRVGNKGIVVGVNVLSAAIARELQLAGVELHSMALPVSNPVTKDHANPGK